MHPHSDDWLRELWSKAIAASDPAEVESILTEFRNAVPERLEQTKKEGRFVNIYQLGAVESCGSFGRAFISS
jgi:hypothetical protein